MLALRAAAISCGSLDTAVELRATLAMYTNKKDASLCADHTYSGSGADPVLAFSLCDAAAKPVIWKISCRITALIDLSSSISMVLEAAHFLTLNHIASAVMS